MRKQFFTTILLTVLTNHLHVNAANTKKTAFFLTTVLNGDVDTAASLLEENPVLMSSRDSYSASALHLAVQKGHDSMIDFLMETGADVNARLDHRGRHREGETVVHFAVVEKRADLVRRLMEHGANATVESGSGMTPLHIACGIGALEVVEVLLDAGGDLRAPASNKFGSLPIHLAASSGNAAKVIDMLLKRGSPAHVANLRGSFPIHGAAMSGDVEGVRLLLAAGAEPSDRDGRGLTPLEAAKAVPSSYGGGGIDSDVLNELEEILGAAQETKGEL